MPRYLQLPNVPQGKKNPLWMGLPTRLKKTRRRADLSMRQCATMAGVTHALIGNVETRGAVPGIDVVERLANALGVPSTWLAYGWEGFVPFAKKMTRPVVPHDDPELVPARTLASNRYRDCGERVRQVREQLGWTLRDVAEQAADQEQHLSHQAILYIETGSNVPKLDTLEAIARALRVPPCWLAYGEEE